VYHPASGRDASFSIRGKTYSLIVDQRVEYFGWEYVLEWLGPIREALADLLSAPSVATIEYISDIANPT
jgi:hypothetical protein